MEIKKTNGTIDDYKEAYEYLLRRSRKKLHRIVKQIEIDNII